jgi:large subunit ribosomal protein L10
MPRPEKVQAVAEIKERLEGAQAVFLAEYAGLSVKEQQALRRGLREGGAEFKVVKMTLARLAAAELELTDLDELFLGPTGIAFADGDPVSAAKALKEFAKENEAFTVKGGLLGTEFLTPERISELADIESRDVLLAKIAGAMKAPMANLAGLLEALPRNLASAMQQLVEKKEESGDTAPAAAAEAETADADASDGADDAADAPEEAPATEAADTAESTEEPEEAAAEDSADDSTSEAEKADEEPAEEVAEPEASTDDGDDAKSVEEDPAEDAEEA